MRHLFALFFGTIIGVGWITATGGWIAAAGPVGAVIAFTVGAAVMTLIGLCYAEAMGALPEARGIVGYVHRMWSDRLAFWTGWLLLLSYAGTLAFFAVSVPWLLAAFAPSLTGPVLYEVFGAPVKAGPLLVTTFIGVGLGVVNHRGVDAAARTQMLVVAIKIGIGVILGLAAVAEGDAANLAPIFAGLPTPQVPLAIVAVAITTPFWFGGFDVLPQAMRERDQEIDLSGLGRLIVYTTGAALAFYVVIIFASSLLLPRSALLDSPLPTFHAFLVGLGSPVLAKAVIISGFIGVLSAWNANLFAGARILNAVGAVAFAPSWFGRSSVRFRTPARAVWSVTLLALLLGLLGPNAIFPLISAVSISLMVSFAILCAGVIKLRRDEPNLRRPYRVPGRGLLRLALILSLGMILLSAIDPFSSEGGVPLAWTIMFVWIAIGQTYWSFSRTARAAIPAEQRAQILAGTEG